MNNFAFANPTKILFGQGQIENIVREIPTDARILMVYGGGSIKRNGVYDQVIKALNGYELVEFPGVTSNPEFELLTDAVEIVRREKLNFILAVGGGSVIDGSKFISAAAPYDGNPWDIVCRKVEVKEAVKLGVVLTMPATGSEMNSGAVVSRRAIKEKRSFGSPLLYPTFSVLDPSIIASIPKRQLVNGVVDAFMHTLEQYLTYSEGGRLQDRFAEGILLTLKEVSDQVTVNPNLCEPAENFMWACTWALNGWISQGVPSDWGVHALGHELTALFGIDHARTLAIIAPRYYEHLIAEKEEKLSQFAERVWDIHDGSRRERAEEGIRRLESFFHSLDVKTRLRDYTDSVEGTAEEIASRFQERGWLGIGERQSVTPEDVEKIVKSAY